MMMRSLEAELSGDALGANGPIKGAIEAVSYI